MMLAASGTLILLDLPTASAAATAGTMVWPTSASIGRGAVPGGHTGLDMGASEGSELRATFDGVVRTVGVDETFNVRPNAQLKCPGTRGGGGGSSSITPAAGRPASTT
jgi:hypothetical protein